MKLHIRRIRLLVIAVLALTVAACGPKTGEDKVTGLLVSPSEVTLELGGEAAGTKQLAAELQYESGETSEAEVNWTSSDALVATVSEEGLVTAVGKGNASMTATLKANSALTSTASVTVVAAKPEDAGDKEPGDDEKPGDEKPGDEKPGDEKPDGDEKPGDETPGDDEKPAKVTLSLTANELELAIGQPGYLTATVSRGGVNWTVAATVGTADDIIQLGKTGTASGAPNTILGLDTGNVTITATSVADPKVKAEVQVTVILPELDRSNVYVGKIITHGDADEGTTVNPFSTIEEGLEMVSDGGTVIIMDGAYVLASQLLVDTPDVTIMGRDEGFSTLSTSSSGVTIDATTNSGGSYGIKVTADGVTLRNFTLTGPQVARAGYTGSYGIQAQNVSGIVIERVTVQDSYGSQISLNDVRDAIVRNVIVRNSITSDGANKAGGAGVAIIGSERVLIQSIKSSGNIWGGVAIFTGKELDQNTSSVTVRNLDSSNEPMPIYTQTHVGNTFNTLTLPGYGYAVRNPDHKTDGANYVFYFQDVEKAIAYATDLSNPDSSTIQLVSEGDASILLNEYRVSTDMSIMRAINAAVTDGVIELLAGTHAPSGALVISTPGLTLRGQGEANTTIDKSEQANGYGLTVDADGVTLEHFTLVGPGSATTEQGFGINAQSGSASTKSLNGLTISNVSVLSSARSGITVNTAGNVVLTNVTATGNKGVGIAIVGSQSVQLTDITTKDNTWGGIGIWTTKAAQNYHFNDTSHVTVSSHASSGTEPVPVYTQVHGTHRISEVRLPDYTTAVRNTDTKSSKGAAAPDYVYYFTDTSSAETYGKAVLLKNITDSHASQTCNVTGVTDVTECDDWQDITN